MNLETRVENAALEVDKAVNDLGGGKPGQTLSGTFGRALAAKKWWAPYVVWLVNLMFGKDHCQNVAAAEATADAPTAAPVGA